MIFSKTSTETIPLKKPKTPKNNTETWYVNKNFFNKYDILNIVEGVLKNAIQWKYFQKHQLKPYH